MIMRYALILSCGLGMQAVYSQVDSTERCIVGVQMDWGVAQHDFSSLHKYGYLLNSPQRIMVSPIIPSMSLFIGDPDKLFMSFEMGIKMGLPKRGTYDNHNVHVSTGNISLGGSATIPLKSYSSGRLQRVYGSLGVRQLFTSIDSRAGLQFPSSQDTSFHYESSRATTTALRGELMFEFSQKVMRDNWDMRFMVKAGYNLQLGQPNWSGTFTRDPNDGSSPVNLGGFTLGVGMNFWRRKGALKAPSSPSPGRAKTTKGVHAGAQMQWGITHLDLSSLDSYGYTLNRPKQVLFTPVLPSMSLFLGNPDKLFGSLDLGLKTGIPVEGTYDNYNIRISTGRVSVGGSAFCLLHSFSSGSLRQVYASLGVKRSLTSISSKAPPSIAEIGSIDATSTIISGGLMVEFSRKAQRSDLGKPRFMVRAGYDLQLTAPEWSGNLTSFPSNGVGPSNLGAFTIGVGMNFWYRPKQVPDVAPDG